MKFEMGSRKSVWTWFRYANLALKLTRQVILIGGLRDEENGFINGSEIQIKNEEKSKLETPEKSKLQTRGNLKLETQKGIPI